MTFIMSIKYDEDITKIHKEISDFLRQTNEYKQKADKCWREKKRDEARFFRHKVLESIIIANKLSHERYADKLLESSVFKIPLESEKGMDGGIHKIYAEDYISWKKRIISMIFFGLPLSTITTLGLVFGLKNNVLDQKSGKIQNDTLVFSPNNTQSLILSNGQPMINITKQSVNKREITGSVIELANLDSPESINLVTKKGRLNTKPAHSSKQKSTSYIIVTAVVALLIVAVGFVLKMQQVKQKKKDLFIDMNQYYANGSTKVNSVMSSIYPNASLNQGNNVI